MIVSYEQLLNYKFVDQEETLIQLVLLKYGIRNAWCFGNPLYEHYYPDLDKHLKLFPNLKKSYSQNFGLIISANDYTSKSFTNVELGKLLGYPCAEEFEESSKTNFHGSVQILCILKNKNMCNVFTNRCLNFNKFEQFKCFCDEAELVLKTDVHTRDIFEKLVICLNCFHGNFSHAVLSPYHNPFTCKWTLN